MYKDVAKFFFDTHKLTSHQIQGYNDCLQNKIPKTIEESSLTFTKNNDTHKLTFQNIYISKPSNIDPNGVKRDLYPSECRDRMMSYSGSITLDIIHEITTFDKKILTKTYPNINIGKIPIMIGSNWCHLKEMSIDQMIDHNECAYDPGGYFLTSGKEYALLSQDRMAHNEIFVFENNVKTVQSTSAVKKVYSHHAIVRSFNEYAEPNISTTMVMITANNIEKGDEPLIYFSLPGFKEDIPLIILYLALNVPINEIESYIATKSTKILKLLQPSLKDIVVDTRVITTQKDAINYLSSYVISQRDKVDSVHYFLKHKFLQNISDMKNKLYNISHMVFLLLSTVVGDRSPDDRDHYSKKRVETSGALINNLFRSGWKSILRETKNLLEKKKNISIQTVFDNKITVLLKKPIETGNWTTSKIIKNTKTGVSDGLNRHNYVSTLCNIRRIITPSDKNSHIVKPRFLHSSHFYYLCPFETPEGHKTGLHKNMSLASTITLGCSEEIVYDYLKRMESVTMISDCDDNFEQGSKIFINGRWVAVTSTVNNIESVLIELRRKNLIPYEVSISISNDILRIYTDEGRLIAPFIKLDNGALPKSEYKSWQELLINGIVEYLDISEYETLYIGCLPWELDVSMTHCFIHPSMIAGVSANSCPFFNCNQSPRVIYQSSMCKQGLGVPALNYYQRNDTTSHKLIAPQKPLIESRINKMIGCNSLPNGQNLVVAIASYTGMNQEDSLLFNKDSVDMGMLRSIYYSTYIESNHRKGTVSIEIKLPERLNVRETRQTGYSRLDSDGLPKENTPLQKRDVVIAKVLNTNESVKDCSVVIKVNGLEENAIKKIDDTYVVGAGSSFVDKVLVTTDDDSNKTAIVKTRQMRIPQIGNKCACIGSRSTLTMTTNGWKFIEDVTLDDKVATLKDGKVVYENPTELHCYDYEGDMYELKTQQVELTVTPNHRMLIDRRYGAKCEYTGIYKLVEAEKLFGKRVRYKKNANFVPVNEVTTFTFPEWQSPRSNLFKPELIVDIKDWIVFFGIWIAEGSASFGKYKGKHIETGVVSIACHKQRVRNAIIPVCEKMGFKLNFSNNTGSINDQRLFAYLKPLSVGAVNKYLPDWVWNLSQENAKILLHSMCLGDGHFKNNNKDSIFSRGTVKYYTSSKKLAYDVQRLALHAGLSANINVPDGRKAGMQTTKKNGTVITTTHDNYDITIVRTKNNPEVNHGMVSQQSGQSEKWVPYKGKVYCLSVPSEVFYVQQNGKPVWTGNSRSAQKGILGLGLPREDMPQCIKTGITPNIIMNPTGFPSRMTISQPKEALKALLCCIKGETGDGTAYENSYSYSYRKNKEVESVYHFNENEWDVSDVYKIEEELEKELTKYGLCKWGDTEMISGMTGEIMKAKIYMCPTYYQALRHMVDDKIHARSQNGPRDILSMQPIDGRRRGGGFRVGEMECWASISHGASNFLIDRLVNNSDSYEYYVCDDCGNAAVANLTNKTFNCRLCHQSSRISKVVIPYSFKLMQQELMATGIGVWVEV